jgi:hypothetical protein
MEGFIGKRVDMGRSYHKRYAAADLWKGRQSSSEEPSF